MLADDMNRTSPVVNEPTTIEIYPIPSLVHLSTLAKAICICFYCLLCVCSVYGNSLVILVILYFRRLRTATNILILNLAIADLLIAVFCMPFSYWAVLIFDDQRWIFGPAMCSLLSFLQGVAVFLSSWTLVVISFDRWMAIMFVLSPRMRLTRSRAVYLVLATWFFSTVMALPLLFVTRSQPRNDVIMCDEDWTIFTNNAEKYQSYYNTAVLILQYVVPQTVLIITYTFIGMKMWNSRIPTSISSKKIVMERHESVKKLIPMVILISALFALCWLPLLLLINIIVVYWEAVASWPYILYAWWFAHGLAMLHSIVNPIVYYLRNARFREGFCYFSRFLPFVHFTEFQLLSDQAKRPRISQKMNPIAYFPIATDRKYRKANH
ncbi:unnamed protein product [Auanema sp. JU1783]|nr:unnamed protein product [Auanema sp. JU1783]